MRVLGVSPPRLCHSDSQRPGGMTSTYGRTPMYGSQTPMYGSGSRTPMYGSQTPLQDGKYVQNTRDGAVGWQRAQQIG
jgi:transcription elongation factor SPT5